MTRQATPDILGAIMAAPVTATEVPIEAIINDGGTQMRNALDIYTVAEYAAAIVDGATFPPVTLYYDGDTYWLADGFHRLAAWKRAFGDPENPGAYIRPTISAEVKAGTRRDAILHAAGANASHGLRRTNADKRRAVEVLLRDPEWSQWSNRVIAAACAVDEGTVRNWRDKVSPTAEIPQSTERKGADGRTIDTANIGTRPSRLFVGDLKGLVAKWMGENWQHAWPDNPAHTNGEFWKGLTAWMHENVRDTWQEGDLKEAIKAIHYQATAPAKMPAPARSEPPSGYTVPEAVEDKPLPEWAVDPEIERQRIQEERNERARQEFSDAGIPCPFCGSVGDWSLDRCTGSDFALRVDVRCPKCDGSWAWIWSDAKPLTALPTVQLTAPTPAPTPTPSRAVNFNDDRMWELRSVETKYQLVIRQLRDYEKEYGRLTGDSMTALEVRHGVEHMVTTLRRNQGIEE